MVLAWEQVVTTRESGGVRSRESQIIRTGFLAAGRRHVSRESSASMVPTPHMTAKYLLLSSWTLWRERSPVIHRECPARVAVLPSSVMAYFMTTRGRPVFM